jgi:hypothetical protein
MKLTEVDFNFIIYVSPAHFIPRHKLMLNKLPCYKYRSLDTKAKECMIERREVFMVC